MRSPARRTRRPTARALGAALFVGCGGAALLGCPPTNELDRDGGTACARESDCNAPGVTCGLLSRCVAGYCSATRVLRVCEDAGATVEAGSSDECFSYVDCNASGACGALVSCVNFRCDSSGPRIEIPCGGDAGGDR